MGFISETIEADASRRHLLAHMIAARRAQIPVLLTAFLTAHGFGGAPGRKPRLTFRPAGIALCYVGRGGLTMSRGMKLIDSTLVIVLHNGDQEIERELTAPADALRVALMMLARRGRLEIGDVLKVVAQTAVARKIAATQSTDQRLPSLVFRH
jgi:hypothetical protein